MKISDIPVETGERYELVSITDEVRQAARDAGVDEGICIISSTHTTAAVTVNEDYDRDVQGPGLRLQGFPGRPGRAFPACRGQQRLPLVGKSLRAVADSLDKRWRVGPGALAGVFLAEFDGPRQDRQGL